VSVVVGMARMEIFGMLFVGSTVRVAVLVLLNAECDEQEASDDTDGATEEDIPDQIDWFVDLCQIEIALRVEEHQNHGDTADEVSDTEDETRGEAVDPLVRLVECIGSGDWPAVARFDPVDYPEGPQPRGIVRRRQSGTSQ